jgi:hypothetical protein
MSLLNNRITAVVAGSVLVVGLGATGAVAGTLVTSAQIENGTIRSADVQDGNLRVKDLRPGAVNKFRSDSGVTDVTADGPYAADALGATQPNSATDVPAHSVRTVWTSCADGMVAISGGHRFGLANESFGPSSFVDGLTVNASEPAYEEGGVLVNSYQSQAQVTPQGGFEPNAWAVTVQNDSDTDQAVRAYVVCVID